MICTEAQVAEFARLRSAGLTLEMAYRQAIAPCEGVSRRVVEARAARVERSAAAARVSEGLAREEARVVRRAAVETVSGKVARMARIEALVEEAARAGKYGDALRGLDLLNKMDGSYVAEAAGAGANDALREMILRGVEEERVGRRSTKDEGRGTK